MLGLGQGQGQDAFGVVGLGSLGVDGGGQGERLLVLTGLEAVPMNRRTFRGRYLCLPLERKGVLLLDDSPLFCYNAA
jgi:hypothetical protein